jgi:hypothetical protein
MYDVPAAGYRFSCRLKSDIEAAWGWPLKEIIMSQRTKNISERIDALKNEMIIFVENLSDEDWKKACEWEEWPVGVTAYHLGAAHFAIAGMLGMVINGDDLPQLTMDQINAKSKADVQEHLDCTKAETLDLLRNNGAKLSAYVDGLSDGDLDRKGSMPAFGGEFSAEQLIDSIIFQSAAQHLESMKTAVGR